MIDPSSAFNPHFDFSSSSNRAFLSLFHFIQVGHHSFDALLEFPWFNQPHNWGFWCLQLTTERFSVDHQRRRYQFGCECEANLIRNKDILVLVLSFFFGYEFQSHPIQTIATAYVRVPQGMSRWAMYATTYANWMAHVAAVQCGSVQIWEYAINLGLRR